MKKRSFRGSRKVVGDIEEFRALLGTVASRYTDAELRQLRREMIAMADILLDLYLVRRQTDAERVIPF